MNYLPSVLLIVFLLFGYTDSLTAQSGQESIHHSQNQLIISSSGEAVVPADFAVLSVTISETHREAQKAFDLHKEQESFLANLLTDLELSEEKINYQPISIRPSRQRDGSTHTSTSQQVRVELEDFNQLSEIQVLLISNGFDNFSGNLASTQMEEAGKLALEQAVKNARMDAEILAQEAGLRIGRVLQIDHSANGGYRPVMAAQTMELRSADYGPSLGDFSQTITVQKRVQIRFELLDSSDH